MFDSSGKDQTPQKIAQVVGQNKQSQPHLIRDKALAGQPRPVQGILAFLDPLLGRAATVVKVNLRWPRLVGQLGGLFKVYSDCHSYRQNLLGQIFLSLLLRL